MKNFPVDEFAIFPLYPIVDGKCPCSRENCKSVGKHPMYGQWTALTPGQHIYGPDGMNCGYGILTGAVSGIWVLDTDVKPEQGINGEDRLAELGGVPRTFTVATPSGGFHRYYKHPGFPVKTSGNEIAPGVDVRGEGGFVVAPESPHRNGGVYTILIDLPIADYRSPIAY